ncbi:MAG: hypothetical protein NTV44_03310, partial [Firmicutes bacterium]|nr:hypothetical protein [Bacillota bacterium]
MFKRLKQSISVMRHKQARLFLLLTIILFNVALWLVTSVLAYIIKPGYYGDILNALLTSGLVWILDPGNYEAEHAELALRILSLVTIIISMITFSGGIIAYVSSWLSSFINRSEGGTRKLYVFNHILILNWNIKALELIADYADDEDAVNIVVVSEHDRQEIEELIATRLYEHGAHKINKKVKIIVVKGNPFSKKTIEKVCLEKARSVIILSDESNLTLGNGHHNDITAMKTMML